MKYIKISMEISIMKKRKTIDIKDWYTENNTSLKEILKINK